MYKIRNKLIFLLFLFLANVHSEQTTYPIRSPAVKNAFDGLFDSMETVVDVAKRFLGVAALNDGEGVKALLTVAGKMAETFFPTPPLPEVPEDTWWGDEFDRNKDTSIRPFQVVFDDVTIQDLRARIYNRRNFTPSLEFAANTYGINSNYLNLFMEYWQNGYDFKMREMLLNRYPQFMTNVQGLDIHYIHIKPYVTDKKVLPVLLIHGSPLTAFEYVHVIEDLLAAKETYEFDLEIIAPDLPGYGYSQPTNKIGFKGHSIAVIFKNLMNKLGHDKFYVHAGDVGEWVGSALVTVYQDNILGYHSSLAHSFRPITLAKTLIGQLYPPAVVELKYENRMYPLFDRFKFLLDNTGYFHMHATRPDTIGTTANGSPSSLAAWILPLLMVGGYGSVENNLEYDGNLSTNYDLDDIVDSLTIYYKTQCMTSSARFYYEGTHKDELRRAIDGSKSKVPFAAIKFKDEIIYQPDSFLRDKYPNLLHSTTLDYGGHFSSLMNPEDVAESILTSIDKMEQFHSKKK